MCRKNVKFVAIARVLTTPKLVSAGHPPRRRLRSLDLGVSVSVL